MLRFATVHGQNRAGSLSRRRHERIPTIREAARSRGVFVPRGLRGRGDSAHHRRPVGGAPTAPPARGDDLGRPHAGSQNADVTIHKLAATDAFIVFDLDGAARSIGPTRLAPKILVDGAELLARSATYLFASFELRVGGASAGINAKPDGRDDAVAAFVAEVKPLVEAGTFTTEAARGLSPADLAPLAGAGGASLPTGEHRDALLVAGVVAAAERAVGALDG